MKRWLPLLALLASCAASAGFFGGNVVNPVWQFDSRTASLAPVFGTGTPTVTRAGATATYTGSDGLIHVASANTARFDYDPITLAIRGLRVEELRTNLALWSEAFDNAAWVPTAATVTADAVIAPDGNSTADKLVESNTNAAHQIVQTFTKAASQLVYEGSVYAKPAGRNWVFLDLEDGLGNGADAYFNVSTGALGGLNSIGTGTALDYSISTAANGFYRVTLTMLSNSAVTIVEAVRTASADGNSSYAGDGVSGLALWGAQVEQGNGQFPTSYIPTTNAAVTRNADVVQLAYSSIKDVQASAGTVSATFNVPAAFQSAAVTPVPVALVKADISQYVLPYSTYSGGYVIDGTSVPANFNPTSLSTMTFGSGHKAAISFAASNYAACADGGAAQTQASGAAPTLDTLQLGGTPTIAFEYLDGLVIAASLLRDPQDSGTVCNLTR